MKSSQHKGEGTEIYIPRAYSILDECLLAEDTNKITTERNPKMGSLAQLEHIFSASKTTHAKRPTIKHLPKPSVEQILVVNIYCTDIFFLKFFNGV